MTSLVASDLDRTLIYSPRAFWLDSEDATAPRIVVSELYQGVPLSFMTRASEDLLRTLSLATSFVPVTTRTVAQYHRIQLPGPVPRYAVTSNGGVILVDGVADTLWSELVRARLDAEVAPLADIVLLLHSPESSGWILKVNNAEDLFVYAIIDRELVPAEWINWLRDACSDRGWTVSVQGRKLYCVPRPVTKHGAVTEVRRRLGSTRVIAAGDSLLDQQMLEEADLAFRPAHGELQDANFTRPHLTITRSRGILAGEELVRLIGDEVLPSTFS